MKTYLMAGIVVFIFLVAALVWIRDFHFSMLGMKTC